MAMAGDHPEAAFYFLCKGGLEKKEIVKYVSVMKTCKDPDLVLFFALEFGKRKMTPYYKICKGLFETLRKKD